MKYSSAFLIFLLLLCLSLYEIFIDLPFFYKYLMIRHGIIFSLFNGCFIFFCFKLNFLMFLICMILNFYCNWNIFHFINFKLYLFKYYFQPLMIMYELVFLFLISSLIYLSLMKNLLNLYNYYFSFDSLKLYFRYSMCLKF